MIFISVVYVEQQHCAYELSFALRLIACFQEHFDTFGLDLSDGVSVPAALYAAGYSRHVVQSLERASLLAKSRFAAVT